MAVCEDMAIAIVQGIKDQMERGIFHDVTVDVGDATFRCHRFLLSACSNYFRTLFCSRTSEDNDRRVKLHDIAPDTFALVLDCVYKAKNIINAENVYSIWRAANQLQISSLLEACEMFNTMHLSRDNCVQIYNYAKMLDCQTLKSMSWNMMILEFEHLRRTDFFFQLDIGDMRALISHEKLNVPSEDVVIDLILRWISHVHRDDGHFNDDVEEDPQANEDTETDPDNQDDKVTEQEVRDRRRLLPDLLAVAKVCLVTGTCLQALMENEMILRNPAAFSIVQEALRYHLQPGRRHDYCSPSAIHRELSTKRNVTMAITALDYEVNMICMTINGTWFELAPPPANFFPCKAVVYENDIYATNSTGNASRYVSKENKWIGLPNMATERDNHTLICHDGFIYAIGGACMEIERFNASSNQQDPRSGQWESMGTLRQEVSNIMATTFGPNIIVFGSKNADCSTTTVQSFNTQTMSTHVFKDEVPGCATNMVGLKSPSGTYVLQQSGTLWKIILCEEQNLRMDVECMLWQHNFELRAAAIVNRKLLVLGRKLDPTMPRGWQTNQPSFIQSIKFIELEGHCFLNSVVHRRFLSNRLNRSNGQDHTRDSIPFHSAQH